MADDTDQDYVSLTVEDNGAVTAIARTTGLKKDRILSLLVRKAIGRPPANAWERHVYQAIDETAAQLDSLDPEEQHA